MTAYVPLTSSAYVTGTPVSFEDFRAVIDNPTAIAEGASGAPRVAIPAAISTPETDTQKTLVPDGVGGVHWAVFPTVVQNLVAVTASGTVTIPIGTRVKVTAIGGGGGGGSTGSPGNGVDTTATDGTTTITGGHGKKNGGTTGTSSGGSGYSTPFDDSHVGGGGNTPGAGGAGPMGGAWGRGGACTAAPGFAGGGASARVATFIMASGTLTVTIGTGGTTGTNGNPGLAGAVIVEW